MNDTNTGGPAFPMSGFDMRHGQPVQAVYQHGMTLRDYFAAKAMQAFITHVDYRTYPDDLLANDAYEMADAMLKARGR